jgi:hypothetical protein
MNREAIYSALFSHLAAAAPFAYTSRRLKHWTDLQPAEKPALMVIQKNETAHRIHGFPPKWTLEVDIYVYCQAPDEYKSASTVLNPLIDAIESALAPPPYAEVQTLGGLVDHCWIEGKTQTDEGALQGDAVCILPVFIMVPT